MSGTGRVLWCGAVGDAPWGRLYVRALYAVGADEEPGRVFDRLDGGGEANAGGAMFARTGARLGANVVEAGESKGEMAPALVAEESVDFVDDDGLYGAKDLTAALGS